MDKYEYLTEKTGINSEISSGYAKSGSEPELKFLNEKGSEGWELCFVKHEPLGDIYYFKRKLSA